MYQKQPRFKIHYKQILSEDLILKQKISCISQLMRMDNIIITHSSSLSQKNIQFLVPPITATMLISGQKPKITQSIKAVANFQTRKNEPIGCITTLTKNKAYTFLEEIGLLISTKATK
uniref:Ribosomal protein L5 n=1 Tax=Tetraselmis sp. CCMP 881 TaxID=1812852 RepID=A0A650ARF0_9CHLO|nr:ribosomal protein L5 [Tetraselmis sp. CCMP 881]